MRGAPGVVDNGSGSVAVLELARMITSNAILFKSHTFMFVLFDLEELVSLLFANLFHIDSYQTNSLLSQRVIRTSLA